MVQHDQKRRKGNLIKYFLPGILKKKKKYTTQSQRAKTTGSLYTYNHWRLQTQEINTLQGTTSYECQLHVMHVKNAEYLSPALQLILHNSTVNIT